MKTQMTFERYELKYILSRPQLQVVLNAMEPHMRRGEFGHSSIRNLYLDTPDYRLIRRSLERPVYKEKVRIRSYGRAGIDDEVFVELKKKYRSVVYKRRLSMPQGRVFGCLQGLDAWPDTQIGQEIAYTVEYCPRLAPMVFLSYERDAFRAADGTDLRITFDTDICFRRNRISLDSDTAGTPLLPRNQVLMEVKVAGGLPLWMARLLSEQKIYKTSFSKYGAAYQATAADGRKGRLTPFFRDFSIPLLPTPSTPAVFCFVWLRPCSWGLCSAS